MTQYRVKCTNPKCAYHGTMEGTSAGGFAKKHFAQINKNKESPGDGSERVQLRCPKCGHRWRMRANQLHG